MAFTDHQKRCMLEIYFRNGVKIDGQWVYSTRNTLEDFQETFPEVIVDFDTFSRKVHRLPGLVILPRVTSFCGYPLKIQLSVHLWLIWMINNSPWMFENVIDSIERSVRLYMHEGSGHITHL
jgi:hypothetical protein